MLIDCNFRYWIVYGTVRLWLDGICKLATTEKWSEIKSEVEIERTLNHEERNHKIKKMTMNVGRKVNVLMEIERLKTYQIAVWHRMMRNQYED